MLESIVLIVALVALGLAALRWGVDSTDGVNSQEWQRRREFSGPRV